MKNFIKNIGLFIAMLLIVGEVVARGTFAMSDIPQRTIDEDGIQKYIPNQKGYWEGGTHHWEINALGWPGKIPKSFDNLHVIIGDSFIENFMNPMECHQAIYLKELMPENNFFEASRSGVTLIESLEISKQTDTLSPLKTIIFTGSGDILESIKEIKKMDDITQYSIKKNEVIQGKMKSPGIKKILYSVKSIYYLYNRFRFRKSNKKKDTKANSQSKSDKFTKHLESIEVLVNYIKKTYDLDTKLFVFAPGSNKDVYNIFAKNGFNTMLLDNTNDKSWSFSHDPHWTCYGHQQVAKQIKKELE